MKKNILLFLSLLMTLVSCEQNESTQSDVLESVEWDHSELTLKVGETKRLLYRITPINIENVSVSAWSSDVSIITTNWDEDVMVIEAIAEGEAFVNIQASRNLEEVSSVCRVLVESADIIEPGPEPEPEEQWGICGTFNDWGMNGEDIPMSLTSDESYYVAKNISFNENDEFKFRANNNWDNNYGIESNTTIKINAKHIALSFGENIRVPKQGVYDIYLGKESQVFYVLNKGLKPGESPKDLSQDGKANCYIVDPSTYYHSVYKFNCRRGIGIPAQAVVVWESFGISEEISKGDLISDVWYEDDYLYFILKDERYGNAVLATIDAEGQPIHWWHIWITEQPKEQTYYNGAILMDRNLGATSVEPGSESVLGLRYQFGRIPNAFLPSGIKSTIAWDGSDPYGYSKYTSIPKYNCWNDIDGNPCPYGWVVPEGTYVIDNGLTLSTVWSEAAAEKGFPVYDSYREGFNASGYFGADNVIWYPFDPDASETEEFYWTNSYDYSQYNNGYKKGNSSVMTKSGDFELTLTEASAGRTGYIRCQKDE